MKFHEEPLELYIFRTGTNPPMSIWFWWKAQETEDSALGAILQVFEILLGYSSSFFITGLLYHQNTSTRYENGEWASHLFPELLRLIFEFFSSY